LISPIYAAALDHWFAACYYTAREEESEPAAIERAAIERAAIKRAAIVLRGSWVLVFQALY